MILATFKMLRLFLTNVPHQWWFLVVMVISFAFGVAYNEVYNTGLPVWAMVFCIVLGIIFIIPCGIVGWPRNAVHLKMLKCCLVADSSHHEL